MHLLSKIIKDAPVVKDFFHLAEIDFIILDYFEETYVGRPVRNLGYDMWSVYQRSLDEERGTNNYAEAAHRRLQTELARDHPTLYVNDW
ncbi:hypothetical protein Ddc_13534 [Ditylenchus destructor]|nr:hypothetical protein Ddc_13534 [Ditylenchus destructor]